MTEIAVSPLSHVETVKLSEYEATIERGLAKFVEVGGALMAIRERRLYRETYATFEEYCLARWGFTDRRGRQLMEAARIGTIVPVLNEAQARELSPLLDKPDVLRETWEEVQSSPEPVTAERIRAAVKEKGVPKTSTRSTQPIVTARHQRVMDYAEGLAREVERWQEDDCLALTPGQARKQLTALNKARDLLDRVIPAVEYRAATLHEFNV